MGIGRGARLGSCRGCRTHSVPPGRTLGPVPMPGGWKVERDSLHLQPFVMRPGGTFVKSEGESPPRGIRILPRGSPKALLRAEGGAAVWLRDREIVLKAGVTAGCWRTFSLRGQDLSLTLPGRSFRHCKTCDWCAWQECKSISN